MPVASSVNLNRLAAFAAVVESGSFTAAAEKIGLTKAMVSQHVSRLEKELGIGLLTRTTRKVTPTETGAAFYADCAQVLHELEAAIRTGRRRIGSAGRHAAADMDLQRERRQDADGSSLVLGQHQQHGVIACVHARRRGCVDPAAIHAGY